MLHWSTRLLHWSMATEFPSLPRRHSPAPNHRGGVHPICLANRAFGAVQVKQPGLRATRAERSAKHEDEAAAKQHRMICLSKSRWVQVSLMKFLLQTANEIVLLLRGGTTLRWVGSRYGRKSADLLDHQPSSQ